MAKFSDQYRPRSKATLSKRRRGEHWEERHDRRFATALGTEFYAKEWAEKHGFTFTVSNEGHHWIIRRPGDVPKEPFAQWWPRTAKLVIYCRWQDGIHVHDVKQLIVELESILAGSCRKAHRLPQPPTATA